MKIERRSNIDLLKILLMTGVVVLHYNNSSAGKAFTYAPIFTMKSYALFFLESVFICAVDVFVLISGYFMITSTKIDVKKPIRLLIQLIVFRESIYIVETLLSGSPISINNILKMLLPQSYFVVLYIAVYLLSPYINKLLRSLTHQQIKVFLVICIILVSVWPYIVDLLSSFTNSSYNGLSTAGMYGSQNGYSLINFLLMYIIGAYIRITEVKVKSVSCIIALFAGWFVIFFSSYMLMTNDISPYLAWEYCNPVVIFCSIFVFLLFNNIKLGYSKLLNSLSKATFSVYLLNTKLLSNFVHTQKFVSGNGCVMLLHILVTCFSICLFCWAVQIVYDIITKPIYGLIDKHLKINTIIDVE